MPRPNGAVIYRGPSKLGRARIMVIATGLSRPSANPKLGSDVISLWVLTENVHPARAIATGLDKATCGSCPLRKPRICNVRPDALGAVWGAAERGSYVETHPEALAAQIASRRLLRLAFFGEVAAAPESVWRPLLGKTTHRVGYTHQWRAEHAQNLRGVAMASVESLSDAKTAWRKGWRTYRLLREGEKPLPGKEMWCPYVTRGVQCSSCGLCDGANEKKSIVAPYGGRVRKEIRT